MHPILAQVEVSGSAGSSTGIIVIGFLFVMIVLATLAAVTSTIGAIFSRKAANDARKALERAQNKAQPNAETAVTPRPETAPTKQVQPTEAVPEDDPVLLAVIAAAVHTVIGQRPHRVISIRTGGPGWAQEGRRQIFSSHRTR